jgi:hypothetical protein
MTNTTMQRDYTGWQTETPAEDTRDGQDASYERWLGKKIAKEAIVEYDSTWKDHCWHEVITRQSVRRFASQLAESSAPSLR